METLTAAGIAGGVTTALGAIVAALIKRNEKVLTHKQDREGQLIDQLSQDIERRVKHQQECEEEKRRLQDRIFDLESRAAQIAGQAMLLEGIAEPYVKGNPPTDESRLNNDALRVMRIATLLIHLARRLEEPQDDEEDAEPVRGIGSNH